jgi:hypothetical protein
VISWLLEIAICAKVGRLWIEFRYMQLREKYLVKN